MFSELSAEQRASLEDQRKATETQLTAECDRLRQEVEIVRGEKKDMEVKMENQQKTLNEQIDRQRQGITDNNYIP